MDGFVFRRSLMSMSMLVAILVVLGGVLVAAGAPAWVPLVGSVAIVALQYAVNPWIIQKLIPAGVIAVRADGSGYDTEHVIGAIVARRCQEANLRLVKLGIIDDGTPNAFTFGHTRSDARVWVSRGLLERLDERELDAVVSHEIGHVVNNDFIVMTFAAVVPMLAYYVYLLARTSRNRNSAPVMIGAYAIYLVSQLVVLALARARESAADHHSCAVTGDGDALASALVKIAYGMGQVRAGLEAEARRLRDDIKTKAARREAVKIDARMHRAETMKVLGIADPGQSGAVLLNLEEGIDPHDVMGALRWETCNPWARFQEFLSSHPIVVHRIAALERSGLPGAPRHWRASDVEASCDAAELERARRRFPAELAIRFGGPALVIGALVAFELGSLSTAAWALLIGGVGLAVRAVLRHPLTTHEPVDRVTSLLRRADASPVTAIPVSVRGRVLGRGVPGYIISPDLVVQDDSGFVPVLYRKGIPLGRTLFALIRAGRYADQQVFVRGWYRREPNPIVELRDIVAADGTKSRAFFWIVDYAFAVVAVLVGALMVFASL